MRMVGIGEFHQQTWYRTKVKEGMRKVEVKVKVRRRTTLQILDRNVGLVVV